MPGNADRLVRVIGGYQPEKILADIERSSIGTAQGIVPRATLIGMSSTTPTSRPWPNTVSTGAGFARECDG